MSDDMQTFMRKIGSGFCNDKNDAARSGKSLSIPDGLKWQRMPDPSGAEIAKRRLRRLAR